MRNMLTLFAVAIAGMPAIASAAFGVSTSTGMNYLDNSGGGITNFKQGQLEDPVNNLAFLVNEGVVTTGSFDVDHDGASGTYSAFSQLNATTLGAGVYGSYLVHFDPAGTPGSLVHASGSVTFDWMTKIVGVAILPGAIMGVGSAPNTLAETDAIFGPGNMYSGSPWRGLELGNVPNSDGFSISADGRTFSFDTGTLGLNARGTGMDEVRLILQAVPEVSSVVAWLMVAGLAIVAWRFHVRRKGQLVVGE